MRAEGVAHSWNDRSPDAAKHDGDVTADIGETATTSKQLERGEEAAVRRRQKQIHTSLHFDRSAVELY